MSLTYKENYWDSVELKRAFIRFLAEVHRLDLSLWDEAGYWDSQYRPFSYFTNNRLVSNVCVYSMDMTVEGQRCRVAQISAVGTLPEHRRQGLSLELMHRAMTWARDNHEFFFLFADEGAGQFYARCGFRPVNEYKAHVAVSGQVARTGAIKLDPQRSDHLDLIYRLASDREPVSDHLGVLNRKLLMFWCLYFLKDHIHYIPDLELLVLYERKSGLVTVYDIVSKRMPVFTEIYPYICEEGDEAVEFLFMIDKLDLNKVDNVAIEGNGTHLSGTFPLAGTHFAFPYTAHA